MMWLFPPICHHLQLNVLILFGYIKHSVYIAQPELQTPRNPPLHLNQEEILWDFSYRISLLNRKDLALTEKMTIRMPQITHAKKILRRSFSNKSSSTSMDIPKGYFSVYVGEEEMKRFVVPVSLLSQPAFQELLQQTEEEFGYSHRTGGLTIPCSEDKFTVLVCSLGAL